MRPFGERISSRNHGILCTGTWGDKEFKLCCSRSAMQNSFTSPQFSASVAFEEHGRDGRKGIVIRNSETYSVGLPS